jgi:hypothetical protein
MDKTIFVCALVANIAWYAADGDYHSILGFLIGLISYRALS